MKRKFDQVKKNKGTRKTTEQFIEEAQSVHENKYKYDNVKYINNKTKVEIICNIHGVFLQRPTDHLHKKGCPKCNGGIKKTIEQFIEEAQNLHKNRYKYDNVKYVNDKTNIEIICNIHGIFLQTPSNHLREQGCPKCASTLKTTKQFIEEAIKIHGDRFIYDKVNYIKNNIKVEIICKSHGSFFQQPVNHTSGGGCKKCTYQFRADISRKSQEEFIEQSIKLHGNEYSYDKVNYINNHTKVEIICKSHGSFFQEPRGHLNFQKCQKCVGNIKKTNEEFIEQAKKIHGDKYIYEKVDYVSKGIKVEIICQIHGSFLQTPNSHLNGHGCLECSQKTRFKNQEYCRTVFEHLFQKKFVSIRPIFLKYLSGKNLELDGYNDELKIAFEYNGIQHYEVIDYFKMDQESLKYQQEKDLFKLEQCKNLSINLIIIPYFNDTKKKIDSFIVNEKNIVDLLDLPY